jgi:NAD(P)-dependent dehydrogenase (short-subunit alcohol dehydrogenase family)
MAGPLTGRVAVVTGAGRGIGAAHARMLAADGAAVVVNDAGTDLAGTTAGEPVAEEVAAMIRADGGQAVADASDVSTFAGAAAAVQAALDAYGRIDILVNNAGIIGGGDPGDLDERDLFRMIAVHVGGSAGTIRAAWPAMRAQRYGRIVNTTSEAAYDLRMGAGIPYATAKAAIWGLTMSAAGEGMAHGITVNAISPGARTRMSEPFLARGGDNGLGLSPEHVARVVAVLVREDAGDISGRVVHAAAGFVREYVLRREPDTALVTRLVSERDLPTGT